MVRHCPTKLGGNRHGGGEDIMFPISQVIQDHLTQES